MSEMIILVDENDNEIGYEEKEKCHRYPAKLHRAFSIFIFNGKNQILVHKRSMLKKTWPGFWTNACCSHPRKGEKIEDATKRRLKEELGISCPLDYLFKFVYEAKYDDQWGEHELDYVFVGKSNDNPNPDKNEIEDWKYIDVEELKRDMKANPQKYTPWFRIALDRVLERMPNS